MTHTAYPSRVGVCSWSLRPSGPAELIERVRRAGLGFVQLALSNVVRAPDVWEDVFETLRDESLGVVSGMMAMEGEDYTTLESIASTGGVRPDATWSANLAHARAVAAIAQREGIALVTFHAGFLPESVRDRERPRLIERVRAIAEVFGERGVRVGLETGQERAETLESILDELAEPNVGVNFDPANMILYGRGDPVEAIRLLAPRVVQVHVKDAIPSATAGMWGREVRAGEGAVDWPAFFAVARAIEPAIDFVIEREQGGERLDDVRAAALLVAEHLGSGCMSPGAFHRGGRLPTA